MLEINSIAMFWKILDIRLSKQNSEFKKSRGNFDNKCSNKLLMSLNITFYVL